jgi:hypothetical protein
MILEFINLETNKLYYSNRYLSTILDKNQGYVTISGTKPACDRLDSSKLIEVWVVIVLKRIIEHKFRSYFKWKTHLLNSKQSKIFRMYHTMRIRAFGQKRIFSSPKCIFCTPHLKLHTLIRKFPVGFSLHFRSSK